MPRSWNRLLVGTAMPFAVALPTAAAHGATPAPVRPTSIDG